MFLDTINKRLIEKQKQANPKAEPVSVMAAEPELPKDVSIVRAEPFKSTFDVDKAKKMAKAQKKKTKRPSDRLVAKAVVAGPTVVEEIREPKVLAEIREDFRLHDLATVQPAKKKSTSGDSVASAKSAGSAVLKAPPNTDNTESKATTEVTHEVKENDPDPDSGLFPIEAEWVTSTEPENPESVKKLRRGDFAATSKMIGVPTPVDLHAEMKKLLSEFEKLEGAPQSLKVLAVECLIAGIGEVRSVLEDMRKKTKQ